MCRYFSDTQQPLDPYKYCIRILRFEVINSKNRIPQSHKYHYKIGKCKMSTDNVYEKVYHNISGLLIWVEFIPLPFSLACSISWIVTALRLLRKRDNLTGSGGHRKSLRLHYVTALHRQRLVQYTLLLIAISGIMTEVTLSAMTAYRTYFEIANHTNHTNHTIINNKSNSNCLTFHLETGQWSNYNQYHWLYIAWFVPMSLFSQAFYWSIALIPITTKSYFNNTTNHKKYICVAALIIIRGIVIAILWLVPFTIPIGILASISSLVFDWVIIMYIFCTGYRVAKNNTKAILKGIDEREALDSKFIPKLRFLFMTFCVVFSIIEISSLQAYLIGYILPMFLYPNCWIGTLYTNSFSHEWSFSKDYTNAFSLIQLISMLEARMVMLLWRVAFIMLSVFAFYLIKKFRMSQSNGKKFKTRKQKKKGVRETSPLLNGTL